MENTDRVKEYEPAAIRIYDRKKNRIIEEISLIAFHKATGKILEVGKAAKQLLSQGDEAAVVCSPLRFGVIADYQLAHTMFRQMLEKESFVKRFTKCKFAVCVPEDITEVEYKAFSDVFLLAGGKDILISEEPAETVERSLDPSYSLLIEIVPQNSGTVRKETWREVCKGQVKEGSRYAGQVRYQKPELTLSLTNGKQGADIIFHKAAALRIFDRKLLSGKLYSEEEIRKYQAEGFKNGIYQIESGQLGSLLGETQTGKARDQRLRQYLIVAKEELFEIAAEDEPEIRGLE